MRDLRLRRHERETLGAGQVRVGIRAAGLNFRDVLTALGTYPGDAGLMGIEGAGTVVEVGPGVSDLVVGDRVMGLFRGSFGTEAVTVESVLTRIPDDWSWVRAASVPVVFLTAYHGLVDLARLRPGESVLVHAGAGGVGMAAVQLARHMGADVFATASPHKWPALRALGLADDRIASSRDLGFADRFRAATGGRGLDVVLNSLTGAFVDASMDLLAPGGRFVEMGKADVRDTVPPDIDYRAFDLLELDHDRIGTLLSAVLDLLVRDEMTPLPAAVWDVRRAPEAFRFVSQARQVGKVVLTVPAAWNPDGTVLVTGGSGALGAVLARHLVTRHSVSRLVLASRSGTVPDLAGLAAHITVEACDVSDPADVADLVARVPAEHPLTAVIHAAGVLDDGVLTALTPEKLANAIRPKANGASVLHDYLGDIAAFVAYSSVVGTLGGAGQAGYAAANARLDALVRSWRAAGVSAQTLVWGPWAGTAGMTHALSEADRHRLTRYTPPLQPEQAMALFDAALSCGDVAPVLTGLDLGALTTDAPAALRGLGRVTRPMAADQRPAEGFADRLARVEPGDRVAITVDRVRGEAAIVLGLPGPDRVPVRQAFRDTGFDSLTGVELRNRLVAGTGARLSPTVVFDHPTPQALAEHLVAALGLAEAGQRPPILDELDRLDALCGAGTTDQSLYEQVAVRLDLLRARWGRPSANGEPDFDVATDDEMFRLLDNELGLS